MDWLELLEDSELLLPKDLTMLPGKHDLQMAISLYWWYCIDLPSGALDSSALHLSYIISSLSSQITIILIFLFFPPLKKIKNLKNRRVPHDL